MRNGVIPNGVFLFFWHSLGRSGLTFHLLASTQRNQALFLPLHLPLFLSRSLSLSLSLSLFLSLSLSFALTLSRALSRSSTFGILSTALDTHMSLQIAYRRVLCILYARVIHNMPWNCDVQRYPPFCCSAIPLFSVCSDTPPPMCSDTPFPVCSGTLFWCAVMPLFGAATLSKTGVFAPPTPFYNNG